MVSSTPVASRRLVIRLRELCRQALAMPHERQNAIPPRTTSARITSTSRRKSHLANRWIAFQTLDNDPSLSFDGEEFLEGLNQGAHRSVHEILPLRLRPFDRARFIDVIVHLSKRRKAEEVLERRIIVS